MKKLTLTFIFFLGFVSSLCAGPVTFLYESTTDATNVGGSESEFVRVLFTFDSDLVNGTGSFGISPTNGSYGPWEGTLQIGTETVTLTGGTIEVFNDAGTTYKSDGYDFRWDAFRGDSTGLFFGSDLKFFRILIIDDDLEMLSSTDLPVSSDFAIEGDRIQDDYAIQDPNDQFLEIFFGRSEFSNTPVDQRRSFTLQQCPFQVPAGCLIAD